MCTVDVWFSYRTSHNLNNCIIITMSNLLEMLVYQEAIPQQRYFCSRSQESVFFNVLILLAWTFGERNATLPSPWLHPKWCFLWLGWTRTITGVTVGHIYPSSDFASYSLFIAVTWRHYTTSQVLQLFNIFITFSLLKRHSFFKCGTLLWNGNWLLEYKWR